MERRIAVLVVCVLLGAVASALVAWACAAWSTARAEGVWLPGAEPGRARLFAAAARPAIAIGVGPQPEAMTGGFGVQWTELDAGGGATGVGVPQFVHVLSGWPVPALEGGATVPAQSVMPVVTLPPKLAAMFPPSARPAPPAAAAVAFAVHSAITIDGRPGPTSLTWVGVPRPRLLPLRPVWRGFVIDVLFWSGIAWLVVRGLFILRRLRRAMRSRCMSCAYPLGTSAVCTECGRPVPVGGKTPGLIFAANMRPALMLALVAGAIINVAVAWGCATASGPKPAPSAIVPTAPDRAWWRRHAPPGTPEAVPISASSARLGPGKTWTSMWQPPGRFVVRIRSGWPMPSMERDWWENETDDGTIAALSGGAQRSYTLWRASLPAPRLLPGGAHGVDPARPVWPGFLVNTLLYAVPFLLIRWGAVSLRARRQPRPAAAPYGAVVL